MKKGLYFLCVCALSMLIFSEFQKNNSPKAKEDSVTTTASGTLEEMPGETPGQTPETAAEKIAYLSFDDGPSEVTPVILDTLKKKNVPATFFLVGSEITAEREEIVKRELAEGHSIGIHTFVHQKNKIYCDEKAFFEDFNLCRDRIHEVTGIYPLLHRFPWGSSNGYVCPIVDDLIEKLKEQNVMSFDWNVSGEDSVRQHVPGASIYRNVAKDLEKYEKPIILLHDSNTMQNTAAVLGEIIDMIAEKGYSFGTLDQREAYTFPANWRR